MSGKSESEPRCPFCDAAIEHLREPDGSCDDHCTRCTWHQHVPSGDEVAQAKLEQQHALERRRE